MDEEENPRGGARGEAGNSTPDDGGADADADAGTDTDDTPSNDASGGDGSADSSAVEDDVSPEDIDIQASIGPDADAPDASDEDLDQHKDPDVGLDKVVLNDDEGSKGLFDDLLAGEPIFENKEVLRPSYTPHELPHRTDQINQMATILVSALRGETPSNILIYGKTGTGKTASAKFVSQELESTSQKYDVPCEVEYINCEVTDTQYRVLAQLANKFIEKNVERIEAEQERLDEMRTRATEDPNALEETPYDSIAEIDERAAELDDDADEMETVPMTGWPTDRVYTTFFDAVDYKERVVVIMLDEIDKLVEKSGDDTLYNLSRMNSELDNSRISIMGISNDLKFTDFLDPRVKSSLGEEEIVFPPYDANQLRDILQHRADVAFKPGALTDDVIPLCAAFAAQEHGDARRALDLLRTAGELAERGQADTVEEAHVRQAQDKIELDRVVEVVRTLPTQSKIVLFAIILLEKNGVRNINTGEVFNIYKRLCEEIDADVLTQRRVTDLISELDMLGIVNAVVVSKGRYGRTKEISLSVPIDETEAVLLTDSRLGDIESAQPFVQARFDN
ncbi:MULTISPECIES: Cdc6/Cdc18 family protein [Haloferax]|uniref:ORC1-type DNA replication protein n=6 Tax=Haloferax TaxID=2251 RepID=A0A384L509_HALVD|nr:MULTISPECIES: ORC1-type DNA replication protein [Haloferax]ADE04491.1 Orc1-type DNA replication protein [Haloferax volcanii DS2]ELY24217.1 Orc1-type DNA replication protein [Haloferax volcanii DS2]ELZ70333.1 Orc1-type DNA replication protein [Haloferax lucentense DSM 14919]ELZ90857.1 Orc1-type DNA replication protein [Haloferax alexandrinus JCM 10717]MBC9984831.1 AAA family ATPase [Haloferax sp. AS1]